MKYLRTNVMPCDRADIWAARSVFATMALTFVVMLPALAADIGFGGDDWAWIWIFHTEGPAAVQRYLTDAGHPGYGPLMNALLWLDGYSRFRLVRAIAIPFALANGWLIWRIFYEGKSSASFAATAAVLYLCAPYVAGLNQSLPHTIYELFVTCYLLSIWLNRYSNSLAVTISAVLCLVGLSIETLAAIEPIRWWFLYQQSRSIRATVRRAVPFAIVIIIVLAARVAIFVPKGVYTNYNSVEHTTLREFLQYFRINLSYFINFGEATQMTVALLRWDRFWVVAIVLVGTLGVFLTLARATDRPSLSTLPLLAVTGVIVLAAGIAPYAAIKQFAQHNGFQMRYAVPAQFGALILAALAVQLLWWAPLRAFVVAASVFVFSCVPLQLAKWMLYDELLLRDFYGQVVAYLATSDPQVLVVQFEPPTGHFLYRRISCLSSYDTNDSLSLAEQGHGSFVYDAACGPEHYSDPNGCRYEGFHAQACPTVRHTAVYHLQLNGKPFYYYQRVPLAELMQRALSGSTLILGRLYVN
jgi:hypothetical protein